MLATADEPQREPMHPLVLMSDFGLTDRFVASMKGVAISVHPELQIHDLTHQIEPFNAWQASYMLSGTMDYWPKGTVFVSVVDPGVGTKRKSVVVQTDSGHFVVTPDNGSLTLVAEKQGVHVVREIDESENRLPGSTASTTFHGRDVYAYTGARLAAGVITFEQVGPALKPEIVQLSYRRPEKIDEKTITGNIMHIEWPFGNVVTNIPKSQLDEMGLTPEKNTSVRVEILHSNENTFSQELRYVVSFGFVDEGKSLIYSDSLQKIGLAINNGNFADKFKTKAGADWKIRIMKLN